MEEHFFSWGDIRKTLADSGQLVQAFPVRHRHSRMARPSPKSRVHPFLTDTRTLGRSTPFPETSAPIFVAIDGENFIGADFLHEAYTRGVRHFILHAAHIERQVIFSSPRSRSRGRTQTSTLGAWLRSLRGTSYLTVKDTIRSLGDLAKRKLDYLDELRPLDSHASMRPGEHPPTTEPTTPRAGLRIAITGSAGKTSTRHFLTEFFSHDYTVYTPPKNFNNAIGIPLSILEITKPYEVYVFELGMSTSGEIDYLSGIIEPEMTVVTNILPAHWKAFESIRGIAQAKAEIFLHQKLPTNMVQSLPEDGSSAKTPPKIPPKIPLGQLKQIFCGKVFYPETTAERGVLESRLQERGLIATPYDPRPYRSDLILSPPPNFDLQTRLHAPQHHNLEIGELGEIVLPICSPFLAPLLALGKTLERVLHPTQVSHPSLGRTEHAFRVLKEIPQRMEERRRVAPKIIDDSYNANPTSMEEVVLAVSALAANGSADNLIFVLADMLELGNQEIAFHERLGRFLHTTLPPASAVFCYGPLMATTARQIDPPTDTDNENANKQEDNDNSHAPLHKNAHNGNNKPLHNEANQQGSTHANKHRRVTHFSDAEKLTAALHSEIGHLRERKKLLRTIMIFKGSNGMRLGNVIRALMDHLPEENTAL